MIRINLQFDPSLTHAILESVKRAMVAMRGNLSIDTRLPPDDPELREAWESDLKKALSADCALLLKVFQNRKFGKGELELKEEAGEGILRACSAVRLKFVETVLAPIPDEALEKGTVDIPALTNDQLLFYTSYRFLAAFQSLILEAIDPALKDLEG